MKIDKKYYLFIFLLILSEIFFFRNILFNDNLIGDRIDGRLTMCITEHWPRYLCGLEKINDLGIFYPVENTLAYSDMLLGYGIIHSFFRFCGLDMFISYKITSIFIHLLGILSLFYFLSKVLKLDYFWAFFGTSAFSFSCTYANQLFHTQLNAISFLPLFLIFFVKSIQNVDNRLKKNIYMYSAIFIIILILYTAWYICFFSALFAFVFILVSMLFCYIKKIDIKDIIKKFGYDIIGYIITTVVLMIPFLLAEFPVMKMSGGYGYDYLKFTIGNIYSFIYSRNSILSHFFDLSNFFKTDEATMGFSSLLLVIYILFFIFLFISHKEENKKSSIWLYKILYITLFICLCLPITIPFTDFSLWYFVYKYFIAGGAIRAVGRFLFFLSLPMSIIIALLGNLFWNVKKIEGKKYIIFMSTLCVLLFVFNINTIGVNSTWNRHEEILSLSYIPNPPKDCKIIYFKNPYPRLSEGMNLNTFIFVSSFYKISSHELALLYNLKTINGYSGVVPKDYGIKEQFCYSMENFYSENYESSVLDWIKRYKLENVYSYDIINRKWEKVNL